MIASIRISIFGWRNRREGHTSWSVDGVALAIHVVWCRNVGISACFSSRLVVDRLVNGADDHGVRQVWRAVTVLEFNDSSVDSTVFSVVRNREWARRGCTEIISRNFTLGTGSVALSVVPLDDVRSIGNQPDRLGLDNVALARWVRRRVVINDIETWVG